MRVSYDKKSCNALQKPYYSPVEAALRWCGLIAHESEILAACTNNPQVVPVSKFPQWPCLRANAEKIFDALINGEMPKGRDGKSVPHEDHVAPARITVRHTELKKWMAEHYPDQRPPFLFDETERSTHSAINADTFRSLQADRDALKARLDKAVEVYRAQKQELDTVSAERDELRAKATNAPSGGESVTERENLLKMLGGMALLIAEKSGRYQRGDSPNASAIASAVAELIEHLPSANNYGLSDRNIRSKLPEAIRLLVDA